MRCLPRFVAAATMLVWRATAAIDAAPRDGPAADIVVREVECAGSAGSAAAWDASEAQGARCGCFAMWAEVRSALSLVVICIFSGACVAVPVALASSFSDDFLSQLLGEGIEKQFCFRNTTGMLHREAYFVEFDIGTVALRWQRWLRSLFPQVFMVAFIPTVYAVTLGSSRWVFVFLLGGTAILVASVVVTSVFLNISPLFDYSIGLVMPATFFSLKLLCPSDSRIPHQSLKQGLVIVVGNLLVNNMFSEGSVRETLRVASCRCAPPTPTDPCVHSHCRRAQDLVRFLQAFVLLNFYREMGRSLMTNASYYLTVADIAGTGLFVNRDIALVPLCVFQTFMSVVFRLEMSNFTDQRIALAVYVLQGVLEVTLRLTSPRRHEWVMNAAQWCRRSEGRGSQRTRLVLSEAVLGASIKERSALPKSSIQPLGAPPSIAAERLASTVYERKLVVRQFHARVILVEMWTEYAGMLLGSLALALSQHYVLYRPFRPFRKYPELFDGDSARFFRELVTNLVVQVGIEVLTDVICLIVQRRWGLDVSAAWGRLPLLSLAPLIFYGMLFASYSGQYRSLFADDLTPCNLQDMCACVGNGLLPGGVRESYCVIIYPNISSALNNTTL